MNRDEIRKQLVGPIATIATPFDADFEVDYGKMYDLTQWWVEQGLVKGRGVIKVAAAMGEGPQLREHEWQSLLRTVVQAADGKAAVVCGLHYKDTVRQIEDARKVQDLGAIALQVSPPVHNGPTQGDIIRFYHDVANAIDIGVMVYKTRGMVGDTIALDTFFKVVEADNVVAIKWQVPAGIEHDAIFALKDRVNIIDNNKDPIRNHKAGGHGYINWTSEINPAYDLNLWDMMEAGKYDEAQAEWDRVFIPLLGFQSKVGAISGGQARLKKGLMKICLMDVGDSRPPSLPLSRDELEELRGIVASFGDFPTQPVLGKQAVTA